MGWTVKSFTVLLHPYYKALLHFTDGLLGTKLLFFPSHEVRLGPTTPKCSFCMLLIIPPVHQT